MVPFGTARDVWCRNYIQPWADICITCAAYVEYGQCCALCWSSARWHLTISRHGMEIIFCMPSLTMYLTYDLCFHLCCVGGVWSMVNAVSADGLSARLHSIMGRRSMEIFILYPELCYVLGAWPILPSALCSWAMTNAVSALAGFLTAPDHCQIQHDKCVCVLSFITYMVFNLCLHQCCMHEEW